MPNNVTPTNLLHMKVTRDLAGVEAPPAMRHSQSVTSYVSLTLQLCGHRLAHRLVLRQRILTLQNTSSFALFGSRETHHHSHILDPAELIIIRTVTVFLLSGESDFCVMSAKSLQLKGDHLVTATFILCTAFLFNV